MRREKKNGSDSKQKWITILWLSNPFSLYITIKEDSAMVYTDWSGEGSFETLIVIRWNSGLSPLPGNHEVLHMSITAWFRAHGWLTYVLISLTHRLVYCIVLYCSLKVAKKTAVWQQSPINKHIWSISSSMVLVSHCPVFSYVLCRLWSP